MAVVASSVASLVPLLAIFSRSCFSKNCNAEELENKFPWMEEELFFLGHKPKQHT